MGHPTPRVTVPVYDRSSATGRFEGPWPYGNRPGVFMGPNRQGQQSALSIGAAPSAAWQLPAGYFVPANQPMQLVYPRPDAETNVNARHRKAFYDGTNAMVYEIPIGVSFGAFPYHYEIITAPAGATIGQDLNDAYYGMLRWTPTSTVTSATIRVRVTDQQLNTIDVVWTVSTSTNFIFIDPAGNDANAGTYASRKQTLANAFGSTYGATANTGAVVVAFTGTYAMPTYTDSDLAPSVTWMQNLTRKPSALIAWPGQTITCTATNSRVSYSAAGSDFFMKDVTFNGYMSSIANYRLLFLYAGVRLTHYNVNWTGANQGTTGDDNATMFYGSQEGSVLTYYFMQRCGESGRVTGGANNYGLCSLYSRQFVLMDECTFTGVANVVCYVKGTNYDVDVRRGNFNANADSDVCSEGFAPIAVSNRIQWQYNRIKTVAGRSIHALESGVANLWFQRNTLYNTRVAGASGSTDGPYLIGSNAIMSASPNVFAGSQVVNTGTECQGTMASAILDSTTLNLIGASRTNWLGQRGAEISGSPAVFAANRPAGLTTIVDRQWNPTDPTIPGGVLPPATLTGTDSTGMQWFSAGGVVPLINTPASLSATIGQTIPALPDGNPTCMAIRYPSAFPAGETPFGIFVNSVPLVQRMYISSWVLFPANFDPNNNNIKWIFFAQNGSAGRNHVVMLSSGDQGSEVGNWLALQGGGGSFNVGGNNSTKPGAITNLTDANIPALKGRWLNVEWDLTLESVPGVSSDGICKFWITDESGNSQLRGYWNNIRYNAPGDPAGFDTVSFTPYYGGGGGAAPSIQHICVGRTLVAGGAAPSLLFTDDFSNDFAKQINGQNFWTSATNVAVTAPMTVGGRTKKFAKFNFGIPAQAVSELRYNLVDQWSDVYVTFDIYIPSGAESPSVGPKALMSGNGNKFFRLWADAPDGTGNGTDPRFGASIYGTQSGLSGGDAALGPQAGLFQDNSTSQIPFDAGVYASLFTDAYRGKWTTVRMRMRASSGPSANNGISFGSFDGVQKWNVTGLNAYGSVYSGMRKGYFMGAQDVTWTNANTCVYIDNVRFSSTSF